MTSDIHSGVYICLLLLIHTRKSSELHNESVDCDYIEGANTGLRSVMTMQTRIYNSDQIKRLSDVHRNLCAARQVDPHSWQGRHIAELLLDKCTGDEALSEIARRVAQ